ncbi:hypothetical protein [Salipiger sp. PrR003]|uniref:hypothetical protein n=1 Tax=Salipiger sp. PrR003 TaxID=2706776 RepID=UPI0013DBE64F|nr:hypothetical protein [Salipiger sp. PrR003]NDV52917.1 hypothetical protein [Salipiger sp. PrR003]
MAPRFKNKKSSGGGGGNFTPKTTVSALLKDPKKDLQVTEDSITFKVELASNAMAGFDSRFAAGTEVEIQVASDRVGAAKNQLGKIEKFLKSNVYMTFENCSVQGNGLVCSWVTNMCRELEKDGVQTNIAMFDQFVKVHPKRTSNDRSFQMIEIFRAENAQSLVGAGSDATSEAIKSIVADLEGMERDAFADEWLTRAREFDNLSVLEQLGVVYDSYSFFPEFSVMAGSGYQAGLRIVDFDDEVEAADKFNFANIWGGLVKEETSEGEVAYRSRTFAEAISASVTPQGKDPITYEAILEKGISGAMEHLASADADGEVTYGNDFIDNLVDYLEFLQSDEAKEAEDLLMEVIPVIRQKTGVGSLDNADEMAAPFNMAAKPFTGSDGQERQRTHNVIGTADVVLMARKDQDTEQFFESYFVSKVNPHHMFGTKQIPARLTQTAYVPKILPTPNTALVEGLDAELEGLAKATAKRYDPREWSKSNSNENSNENDNENERDLENEGQSPGMNA